MWRNSEYYHWVQFGGCVKNVTVLKLLDPNQHRYKNFDLSTFVNLKVLRITGIIANPTLSLNIKCIFKLMWVGINTRVNCKFIQLTRVLIYHLIKSHQFQIQSQIV